MQDQLTCYIPRCPGMAAAGERHLCAHHLGRLSFYGDPLGAPPLCSFEGCDTRAVAHGLCMKHYQRRRRHGDPSTVLLPRYDSDWQARFWSQVDKQADHWLYTGRAHPNGYGVLRPGPDGKPYEYAHRVGFLLQNGPIPAGLHIDHLCYVKLCVWGGHLEAVTRSENARRERATRASGRPILPGPGLLST